VVLPWRWYYHLSSLALFWGLLVLPLVVARENRRWPAWAVLLPLVPILVISGIVIEGLLPVSRPGPDFRFFFLLWLAFVIMRQMQRSLSHRLPRLAWVSAVLILSALALSLWIRNGGLADTVDDLLLFVMSATVIFGLMLPMALLICYRRRSLSPDRSTAWPFLWTLLTATNVALIIVVW
jgi:hypothetical protein